MVSTEPQDHDPSTDHEAPTGEPEGDLPTRPPSEAKPGQDPGGVDDTGGPTDPEHPSG